MRVYKLTAILTLALGACVGDLNFDSDDSNLRISSGGDSEEPKTPPSNNRPGNNNNPNVPSQPEETFLEYASTGTRCVGGTPQRYIVLSDLPVSCETHALAIDADANPPTPGLVVIPDSARSGQRQYCSSATDCQTLDLSVSLNGATGSWTSNGQTQQFTTVDCDYDAVAPPPVSDIPAKGISIASTAIYQGVKIPLVEEGQMVGTRSAPVIARRPGVVRVFVQLEPDWQPHEIVAVLTLGEDLQKEVRFTPTANSTETDGASTINFELAEGELPADAQFQVQLLEGAQCDASISGASATWSVPAQPTDLGVEALAKPMEIVLAPLRYNADGSGRVPNLGPQVVQRYHDIAYQFYPVAEVNITVLDPIDYNGGMAPNGGGFGQTLNFCINQRAQQNVDPDVYFYCLVQPAPTVQQFCGGGCVAGVAPLAGPNDVGNRAGLGIAFDNSGEDTFVHEIGHAMGRPHSPCGGAAGADPGYPYQQGVIGSWGYSVLSGNLVDPNARDFMGYCEPTWVSDYVYQRIFDRLEIVIGTQAALISTPPTRWKTAILDMDGSLQWDEDRMVTGLPGGVSVQANMTDLNNQPMPQPRVFVTPVADIDAMLLTIEDTGQGGAQIEIPGIGTLPL